MSPPKSERGYEIIERWESGALFVRYKNGEYDVLGGIHADDTLDRNHEVIAHLAAKHNALKLVSRFNTADVGVGGLGEWHKTLIRIRGQLRSHEPLSTEDVDTVILALGALTAKIITGL